MPPRFLSLSYSSAALPTGMVLAGCAALRPPAGTSSSGPQTALVQAQPVTDAPATPVTPSTTTLLDELPADVRDAMTKYTASGKAPLIDKRKEGGFLRFPYGLSQPVVLCRTDTLCDIELEPGEEVLDLGAADTVRWQFQLRSSPPVPVTWVRQQTRHSAEIGDRLWAQGCALPVRPTSVSDATCESGVVPLR